MTFIPGVQSANAASDLDGPGPMSWLQETSEQVAMRQLRHHTKNALQRLLCQIESCPGLQRDPAGRALASDLERRISISASLSDALFGLTHAPSPLEVRMQAMARAVVALMADGDQEIEVTVKVDGVCPASYDDVLVRVAHELINNAVKHGMQLRLVGRIEVGIDASAQGVTLTVVDDGWGPCANAGRGEGLRIAHLLAEQHGGVLSLDRDRCRTVARLALPAHHRFRRVAL